MMVKEESEKAVVKLNMQKAKIMVSGPITLWQIEEERVEAVTCFIFLGSNITVDSDWSHETKRHFAPWKESYDKSRWHIKKQGYQFAPTKVHIVKAMVSPVVMYGCESWTIKKVECQRTDALELWW